MIPVSYTHLDVYKRQVFERMGMKEEECVLTEDGLDAVIKLHENTSGIRDLELSLIHI